MIGEELETRNFFGALDHICALTMAIFVTGKQLLVGLNTIRDMTR